MNLSISLTVALYVAAAGLLAWRLRSREAALNGYRGPALGLGIAAVLAHGWLLKLSLWQAQGLSLNLGHALSLFTWLSALLLCLLSLRRPLDNLGIMLFPLAAAGAVLGLLLPGGAGTLIEVRWTVQLH
ncbi:MAG: hypothetical protein ACRES4_11215, partial [Nevskiales bacterium]